MPGFVPYKLLAIFCTGSYMVGGIADWFHQNERVNFFKTPYPLHGAFFMVVDELDSRFLKLEAVISFCHIVQHRINFFNGV